MDGNEWVHVSTPYLKPRGRGQQDAWSEETAAQGRKGSQRIVHARDVDAPDEVAALLDLPEGAAVVERRRIIYLDGEATELTNTYYPAGIARGTRLAETAKITGGAVTLLANLGYVGHRVREEVGARLPDAVEREVLALGALDPVLRLVRVTSSITDQPFQVDVSVFPAATQRLRYEMRIG
ncbi:GntR family transcriptional regulator [Embleya hyalina]|uniref:GntR family transcriptional regulator n=1 Tax=Embleya hyalina TaxID=516124 RepID=A0A401Z1Z9_9ACTN|nr:UTRA domain-containing protein [Embleya hyalina]GCE00913.1 GntR family transcriptional regulator [Embleya hyalina]